VVKYLIYNGEEHGFVLIFYPYTILKTVIEYCAKYIKYFEIYGAGDGGGI
jgi:hypothetical protein